MDRRIVDAPSVLKINLRPDSSSTVCVGVALSDQFGKPAEYIRLPALNVEEAAGLVGTILQQRGTTTIEWLPREVTDDPADAAWPTDLAERLRTALEAHGVSSLPLCALCGRHHETTRGCAGEDR